MTEELGWPSPIATGSSVSTDLTTVSRIPEESIRLGSESNPTYRLLDDSLRKRSFMH
jgi:hypothetical protein